MSASDVNASQMHYNSPMKTTTIPSVRVAPGLRADIEKLLTEGETLSQFVEASVVEAVRKRRNQDEFLARGLASLTHARATDDFVEPAEVLARLDSKLAAARAKAKARAV